MPSVKKTNYNRKSATLFGFQLTHTSALILYIIALFGMIFSFIGMAFVLLGIYTLMVAQNQTEQTVDGTDTTSTNTSQDILTSTLFGTYIIYFIIWLIIFFICLYIMAQCRKAR